MAAIGLVACASDGGSSEDAPITEPHGVGLSAPSAGRLYHGVFPGDDPSVSDAEENAVSAATVDSYEAAVAAKVAWVYFSHNWYQGRGFPRETAAWIRDRGALPFIRLMLRSSGEQSIAEPTFTLQRIVDGDFDQDLTSWGSSAATFATPLAVEFGTEVNGRWFSWNGAWHGASSAGPALFRDAFRHIVRVISAAGAANITWVFHVAAEDVPDDEWNRFESYYPGDDAVDWVGVSIYGTESPLDSQWTDFASALDAVSKRFTQLAPSKPLMVLEFGASAGASGGTPAQWAGAALDQLLGGRWPMVRGFAWWNETWQNDDNPAHDTDMRVETVADLAKAFKTRLGSPTVVQAPLVP